MSNVGVTPTYISYTATPRITAGKGVQKRTELLSSLWRDEEGADATEYALMLGLIALVIIGAVSALGSRLNTLFQNYSNQLPNLGS